MRKQTAHNLNEVRALVKESYSRGEEDHYQGTLWLTHTGELICKTRIDLIEFEMILADGSSLTAEVL